MKLITYLFLLCLPGYKYEPVKLVQDEYKLSSGGRPGGMSRAIVRLQVPPRTDRLIYTVVARESNPLHNLGLYTQLKEKTDAGSITVGAKLADKLSAPHGNGVADVFIIPDSSRAYAYARHRSDVAYCSEPHTRRRVSRAIVDIPIRHSRRDTVLYLVLRNPTAFAAQYVSIEVVAMRRR